MRNGDGRPSLGWESHFSSAFPIPHFVCCDGYHVRRPRYRRPCAGLLEQDRVGESPAWRPRVAPSTTLHNLPTGGLCPLCSCPTLELTVRQEEHWTAYTYVCFGCRGTLLAPR
jgi:hypothetical protein